MSYNFKIAAKPILMLSVLLLFFKSASGQDTIRIRKSLIIGKADNYVVAEGSVLVLGPNVRILVEGSIDLRGTELNPIQIISENNFYQN